MMLGFRFQVSGFRKESGKTSEQVGELSLVERSELGSSRRLVSRSGSNNK